MFTHKDAKTMAKSLRDALDNRNILLSHSDCLEIVARQFGSADWNTLFAKLTNEEQPRGLPPGTQSAPTSSLGGIAKQTTNDAAAPATQTAAPWTTCSFCGKSRPEVRIVLGGCGGWEGFRARRNPETGERSNVFICNECVALTSRIVTGTVEIPKMADAAE